MNNFFVSCAYVYPLCPLNINHAKMFVVGDIIARNERKKGKNVFFPIAMHYSGNSAQSVSKVFSNFFSNDNKNHTEKDQEVFNLYNDIYKTPLSSLKSFVNPLNILSFYTKEILGELNSLDVSCDYSYFYTTDNQDFSIFINTIISMYEKDNLLVSNKNGDFALDYNSAEWKKKSLELINQTEFIQAFHKNNIISSVKNVRNDWALLRKNGFGAIFKEEWIVDPMFDSEIFSVFDLYIRFKNENQNSSFNSKEFFEKLFKVLKNGEKTSDELINKIIDFLPCDVFVLEEHLKNWIVKKMYAESFLLDKKYQTKKYFVLGMGFLDGKKISASKGRPLLTKDLIQEYGPTKSRLIIILSGGHPSKMYEYDKTLPSQASKLINDFVREYRYLLSVTDKEINQSESIDNNFKFKLISDRIKENIEKGYYRQAVIELLSVLPKEYRKNPDSRKINDLLNLYRKYLDILLPSLLKEFNL